MERTQIDAILMKTDLLALVEQAGGRLAKNYGHDLRGTCPLHGGKNANAFAVYHGDDGTQLWKCFSGDCGGGDAISFVMKWKGLRFPDAIKFLGGEPLTREQEAVIAIQRAERAARWAEEAAREARAAVEALKSTEVWLQYHQQLDDDSRALWVERGIPEEWQGIWKLGYCRSKRYATKQGELLTSSLTMPIFDYGWDVLNISHRLLNPLDPSDKYRPEKTGLKSAPYICDPDTPKDKAENILIVEGQIKAMVSYITLDDPRWQVIGVPGKDANKIKGELIADYKGKNVITCFDPDGNEQAQNFTRAIGGKMFILPVKIDDLIVKHGMGTNTLRGIIRQAVRV